MKMHQGNTIMGGQSQNTVKTLPVKSEDIQLLEDSVRKPYGHRVNFPAFKAPEGEFFMRTAYTFDANGNVSNQFILARTLLHTPYNFDREWRGNWIAIPTAEGLYDRTIPAGPKNLINNSQFIHFLQFMEHQWNAGIVNGFITDRFLVPKPKDRWVNKKVVNGRTEYGSDIPMSGNEVTKTAYDEYEAAMLADDMLGHSNVIQVSLNGFMPIMTSHLNMQPLPSTSAWFDMAQITKNLHIKYPPIKNYVSGYAAINFAAHKENDNFFGLQKYKAGQAGEKNVLRGDGLLYSSAMSGKENHAHVLFEWIDRDPLSRNRPSRAASLAKVTADSPPLEFDWVGELSTQDNADKNDMTVKYNIAGISQRIHNQTITSTGGVIDMGVLSGLTGAISMENTVTHDEPIGEPTEFLAGQDYIDEPISEDVNDDLEEKLAEYRLTIGSTHFG